MNMLICHLYFEVMVFNATVAFSPFYLCLTNDSSMHPSQWYLRELSFLNSEILEICFRYELALQEQNPKVMLPYWDSSLDQEMWMCCKECGIFQIRAIPLGGLCI
jgi:hypothetical protein